MVAFMDMAANRASPGFGGGRWGDGFGGELQGAEHFFSDTADGAGFGRFGSFVNVSADFAFPRSYGGHGRLLR